MNGEGMIKVGTLMPTREMTVCALFVVSEFIILMQFCAFIGVLCDKCYK